MRTEKEIIRALQDNMAAQQALINYIKENNKVNDKFFMKTYYIALGKQQGLEYALNNDLWVLEDKEDE